MIFQLLVSSLIPLRSENILYIITIHLSLLRLYSSEYGLSVPGAIEYNVYSILFDGIVYKCHLSQFG